MHILFAIHASILPLQKYRMGLAHPFKNWSRLKLWWALEFASTWLSNLYSSLDLTWTDTSMLFPRFLNIARVLSAPFWELFQTKSTMSLQLRYRPTSFYLSLDPTWSNQHFHVRSHRHFVTFTTLKSTIVRMFEWRVDILRKCYQFEWPLIEPGRSIVRRTLFGCFYLLKLYCEINAHLSNYMIVYKLYKLYKSCRNFMIALLSFEILD